MRVINFLICLMPGILITVLLFFKNLELRRYKWQLAAFFLMGAGSLYVAAKWELWAGSLLPNFSVVLDKSGNMLPVQNHELLGLWLQMFTSVGLSEELTKILPALCVYRFLKTRPTLLFFGVVMTGLGMGTFETLYFETLHAIPNLLNLIARMLFSIPLHVVFATFDAWILLQGLAKNRPVILSILIVIVTTGFAHGTLDALLLGPLLGKAVAILMIPILFYFGLRLLWRQCRLNTDVG